MASNLNCPSTPEHDGWIRGISKSPFIKGACCSQQGPPPGQYPQQQPLGQPPKQGYSTGSMLGSFAGGAAVGGLGGYMLGNHHGSNQGYQGQHVSLLCSSNEYAPHTFSFCENGSEEQ